MNLTGFKLKATSIYHAPLTIWHLTVSSRDLDSFLVVELRGCDPRHSRRLEQILIIGGRSEGQSLNDVFLLTLSDEGLSACPPVQTPLSSVPFWDPPHVGVQRRNWFESAWGQTLLPALLILLIRRKSMVNILKGNAINLIMFLSLLSFSTNLLIFLHLCPLADSPPTIHHVSFPQFLNARSMPTQLCCCSCVCAWGRVTATPNRRESALVGGSRSKATSPSQSQEPLASPSPSQVRWHRWCPPSAAPQILARTPRIGCNRSNLGKGRWCSRRSERGCTPDKSHRWDEGPNRPPLEDTSKIDCLQQPGGNLAQVVYCVRC